MFENDRHFSHLSTLEREMTFRTEMGLYYSYYKTVVEAPTFMDGVAELYANNLTEYPSTINTLKRFNLYPEVFLGGLFRVFTSVAESRGWDVVQCWRVDRGKDMSPVQSCDGPGDVAIFYINGVWAFAGLTMAFLYLQAAEMSNSIFGGLLAVVCFFYNHSESTRVMWTPPLRESFAFPFCIAQMYLVTKMLRQRHSTAADIFLLSASTAIFIVIWQFAQFSLFTQLCAVYGVYVMGFIDREGYRGIVAGLAFGLLTAIVLMFGNEMLFTSWFGSAVLSALAILVLLPERMEESLQSRLSAWVGIPFRAVLLPLGTVAVKTVIGATLGIKDDAHVFSILRSKFSDYRDFHTLLYTCAREFDFLGLEMPYKTTLTLLLPAAALASCLAFYHTIRAMMNKKERVDAAVVYNVAQMVCYGIMALIIMRLKLFFTPQMCVVAGLLASKKMLAPFVPRREMQLACVVALVAAMSIQGVANIKSQYQIMGEYSNPSLEELVDWIKLGNIPASNDGSIAGPMPLMANLLLSTRRPIINHPHYEDAGMRERTRQVYKMYSRRTAKEVHEAMRSLGANYTVLAKDWCLRTSAGGCGMTDIWDVEEPEMMSNDPICPILYNSKNPWPFQRLWANAEYVVLKV